MKRLVGTLLFIILFYNTSISQTVQEFVKAGNPDAIGFDTERLRKIDTLLSGYVNDGIMPNALSLVIKDGEIIHFSAYGYNDAEKKVTVKKDDIFRNASQTKAITTTVLMTLFEENRFMLDDPIEKYLSMFAHPRVYVSGSAKEGNLVTRPASRSITIRHLLTHTSGYGYDAFGENIRGINYIEPTTSKEVMERLARVPLMHDPGERFTYGFSTDIAGYLAEVLTGKSLGTLMKERVFDPLGMKDTYFHLPKEKYSRLVKCYMRTNDSTRYVLNPDPFEQTFPFASDQPYNGGGGGLCGTIEDYARFCQMILNGGVFNNRRILGRRTVELMCTDQLAGIPQNHPFSLGFEVTDFNRFKRSMVSEGSVKWGGAYGTDYIIDRKENMILLLYTNIVPWVNPNVQDRFHITVYQSLK